MALAMAVAATTTTADLYVNYFTMGNYISEGMCNYISECVGDGHEAMPASITLDIEFRVNQTYHSSDGALTSRTEESIGDFTSLHPYHSLTYDLLSTIIARMNLPFPLQNMQCFEYPNMPENNFLLNVHDLIIHLLEDVRSTASTCFSQSESAAGRKLLLCLTVDIERRVVLPRHEIEAIDRLRKKEERRLQLHQFVSAMVRTDSEDPYLDFSSVERRIGREVRDTAPTEKAFLDRRYEKELELSLLEQAMGDYFQEPLETLTFQGNNNIGKEEQVLCGICKNEILIGSRATLMPCSHRYHFRCIADWLKRSLMCPSCPFKLTTS